MRARLPRLPRLRAPTVDADEITLARGPLACLAEFRARSVDASARCAVASRPTLPVRRALAPRGDGCDAPTLEAESIALGVTRIGVCLARVRRERVEGPPAGRAGTAWRRAGARGGRPAPPAEESVATLERRAAVGAGLESATHDAPAARGGRGQVGGDPITTFELTSGFRGATLDVGRVERQRIVPQRATELPSALTCETPGRNRSAAPRLARLGHGLQCVAEALDQPFPRLRRRPGRRWARRQHCSKEQKAQGYRLAGDRGDHAHGSSRSPHAVEPSSGQIAFAVWSTSRAAQTDSPSCAEELQSTFGASVNT